MAISACMAERAMPTPLMSTIDQEPADPAGVVDLVVPHIANPTVSPSARIAERRPSLLAQVCQRGEAAKRQPTVASECAECRLTSTGLDTIRPRALPQGVGRELTASETNPWSLSGVPSRTMAEEDAT